MNKRTTKFYRKNEADVMLALGLTPTKNSGAGWIEKEDGQNEYIIAQLKSTDAASIRIQQKDIEILEYNASVAHKVPCFVVQFLNNNDIFVMGRPQDLEKIVTYINTGKCEVKPLSVILEGSSNTPKREVEPIKSDKESRESFWNNKEKENEKWQKKKRYKRK